MLSAIGLISATALFATVPSATAAVAKGSPIKLGFINQENDPAGDFTPVDVGVTAGVKYINDTLGGIDGHPITLDKCITTSTAGGDTCAEQMVRDKVVMVVGGVNSTGAEIFPVLKSAGIPYLASSPVSTADLEGDGNHFFFFGGSLAEFPAQAAAIVKSGVKKMVIFQLTGPAGQLVDTLIKPILTAGHVSMTIVTEAAGSADFTSQLTVVKSDNPQAVMVAFVPPDCTKILQEAPSLGLSVPTYYTGECATSSILATAGSAAKGAIFSVQSLPLTDASPQVTIFHKAMPGSTDANNEQGFGTMMDVYSVLKKAGGTSATGASILKVVKKSTNVPGFLGAPYTCSKPPLALAPSVCNVSVRLVQATGKGGTKDISGHWVSGAKP